MSRWFGFVVIGSVVLLLASCQTMPEHDLDSSYRAAVVDAALAEEDEIANNLAFISRENPELIWNDDRTRLLVATWKAREAYEKFLEPYTATSDSEDYAVWVTLVPQVQKFCNEYVQRTSGPKADVDLRLKQYLGLNHSWNYDVFVELWVSPDQLFRPCVDPETTDQVCALKFGESTPTVQNIGDYREFYKNLYYKSFRSSAGVPWTGLGYTYDWGSHDSEVGASEFILAPGASYEIRRVIPTTEYCS